MIYWLLTLGFNGFVVAGLNEDEKNGLNPTWVLWYATSIYKNKLI